MLFVDENFGAWEGMDDPDMQEFYEDVQRNSRYKNCVICGRAVRIMPQYDKCDSCCRKIEHGYDVEHCDPADYEPLPEEQIRGDLVVFDEDDDDNVSDYIFDD